MIFEGQQQHIAEGLKGRFASWMHIVAHRQRGTPVMFYNRKLLEKCWSCYWCDQTFDDPSFVRYHVRAKHPLHCNACLKAFTTFDLFSRHAQQCLESREDLEYMKVKKLSS